MEHIVFFARDEGEGDDSSDHRLFICRVVMLKKLRNFKRGFARSLSYYDSPMVKQNIVGTCIR